MLIAYDDTDDEAVTVGCHARPMAIKHAGAARYAAAMKRHIDKALLQARGDLVLEFLRSPGKWPDGIDTRWDRWHVADEWESESVKAVANNTAIWTGPQEPVTAVTVVTDSVVTDSPVTVDAVTAVTAMSDAERARAYRARRAASKAA